MHYRHAYHAGNFADVFKHVLLCGLLQAMARKDKPWMFLETHAGAGLYDLSGEAAGTTAEWRDGIGRLKGVKDVPEPLASYLQVVRAHNKGNVPSPPAARALDAPASSARQAARLTYPGSPLFAQALGSGRLVLCEKVPEVCAELKSCVSAEVHQRDGYEMHALLPPKEKRGLVLIDPPFEARDEFTRISEFLSRAMARFAGGIYAVWFPLKNRHEAQRFTRRCARELPAPALSIEFETGAPGEGQMRACGLLVLNPPFRFQEEMEPALKLLTRQLAQGPRPAYTMGIVQAEVRPTASAKPRR